MSIIGSSFASLPGLDTAYSTYQNEFAWGAEPRMRLIMGVMLDSATVDSGASPTTRLRKGLVLGKITSSGKYTQYSATATDGSNVALGVLMTEIRTVDVLSGSATDRFVAALMGGPVQAAKLNGLDQKARSDMFGRFFFDDDFVGNRSNIARVIAKTADYTVTATDNNSIFTNRGASGAVNFTLPTIALGLRYRFFVEADQNVTVTSATADTLVCFNDAAADSIAFSTTAEKIGGAIEVYANDNASKWLVFVNLGAETQTPTIAT